MAWYTTWLRADLENPPQVQPIHGVMFSQDRMGNLIGVRVYYNGAAAALSGTVTGYVIRADGETVLVSGRLENNNEAYIVLPQAAYAIVGQISVVIKLSDENSDTTLCACTAYVQRSRTDAIVDPGGVIPDIATLLAQIDQMHAATANANDAAARAGAATARIDNLQPNIRAEQISGDHYRLVADNTEVTPGSNRPRKIVLVGDSYALGYVSGQATYNTPWTSVVRDNLDPEAAVYSVAKGGASFSDPAAQYQFANIFDPDVANPDPTDGSYRALDIPSGVAASEITDVYLFAGRNDFSIFLLYADSSYNSPYLNNAALIVDGMTAFIAECHARFPNAQVSIGMIGGISKDGYNTLVPSLALNGEAARLKTEEIYAQCSMHGARHIGACDAILRDNALMSVDGIHPNQSGQNELGEYLTNAIRGERVDVARLRSVTAAPATGWQVSSSSDVWGGTTSGIINVDETQSGRRVTVSTRGPMILERTSGNPLSIGNNTRYPLFALASSCFAGDEYIRGIMPALIVLYDSSETAHVSRASLELKHGSVQLYYEGMKPDGAYDSSFSAVRVYIPTISMSV